MHTALKLSRITPDTARHLTENIITNATEDIFRTLNKKNEISKLSEVLINSTDAFFIGRGIDHALACEASLKLKEITYIHSEAYAAGELKHGAISLISSGTNVIAIISDKELLSKTLSNMKEVKARGGFVIAICPYEFNIPKDCADAVFSLPSTECELSFLSASVSFQLLSYYAAVKRGCDVDKPRNLAKSVTVE